MDAKRENNEVCILEPDDFPGDDEDEVEGGKIFQLDDDFTYYVERIRKGNYSIKGRKL